MAVSNASETTIRRGAKALLAEIRATRDPRLVNVSLLAERSGLSRATVNRAPELIRAFRVDAESILMEGRSETQLLAENARLRERMMVAEAKADGRREEIAALKESVQTLAQQVQVLALDNESLRDDLDSLARVRELRGQ